LECHTHEEEHIEPDEDVIGSLDVMEDARQNRAVSIDLCAVPDLPLIVKQDLYRVAQEALHNTVKHAHAGRVRVRLHQTSQAVALEVCDDSRGFDAATSFPGPGIAFHARACERP
jgi:signal transduction histidine kinase